MMRALVLAGDPWHPATTVQRGLATLGAEEFRFEFADASATCPARIPEEHNILVLAKANLLAGAGQKPWLGSEAGRGLVDFVRRGGGLLAVHGGISRYDGLPAVNALLGGSFVSHPKACRVTVEPQAESLLTREINAFCAVDEHYFVNLNDGEADVFLRSTSVFGTQPAGWTRREGDGRVCVLTPGHDTQMWLHPSFHTLLLNALHWIAKKI